jgi:cytochrome c biogenesis protein CcmG/thiol:disulfide interchange protein DsbE
MEVALVMRTLRRIAALALPVILVAGACRAGDGAAKKDATLTVAPAPAKSGKVNAAPDFTLVAVDGKKHSLSDYKGQVVLLDFWATWCGPCRMEIPHFKQLHEKYKDKGLAILGVSLDQQGAAAVKPFVEKHQIPFPSLLANAEVYQAYGKPTSIPTTFLIDRKGQVQKIYRGYQDLAVFEADIAALL